MIVAINHHHRRPTATGEALFFNRQRNTLIIGGFTQLDTQLFPVHPDSTTDDPRWECVDIRAVEDMPKPVTLKDVKANPKLADMALVTSMRLSVQPVKEDEWLEVCRMGGLKS